MYKIMAVNAGSSSLKFKLFEMPEEKVIAEGIFEKIGLSDPLFKIKYGTIEEKQRVDIKNHQDAVEMLLKVLVDKKIVSKLEEISGVGHRILHCGEFYNDSVLMTEESIKNVASVNDLGPLHNPANLMGVDAFMKALPGVPNVGVFDTSFHLTMEPEAYMYAVPYEWYTDYKVRKYGAHGTSHEFVMKRTAELMGKDPSELNILTCHLGNGASISAIKNGKVVNTSMGLSPLGGIMMGTRCGDIDPTVVYYMEEKLGCTPEEMDTYLNKKSGMLGVSGISSDARDIQAAVDAGNPRAITTYNLYVNRAVNLIGGYYMQLGHVDAMSFTAGLGEHAVEIREGILKGLEEGMGVKIDYELNSKTHSEAKISLPDSKVEVFVVPTNEELVIARDTVRLLGL